MQRLEATRNQVATWGQYHRASVEEKTNTKAFKANLIRNSIPHPPFLLPFGRGLIDKSCQTPMLPTEKPLG
ncbi:hypothetical protein BH10CYA1_BH10CYA1_15250 [soil metagenome]